MKRIIIFCVTILFYVCSFAQAPQKMSYQAVIRNSSNTLVINTQVGMQISILQGAANGTAVYVETQTPTSNANGLVSLEVGTGTVVSGTFAAINWANGPYFIKTETDPTGGTNYTINGTTELLSVPYAMYAANSGSSIPGPQGSQGPAGNDGAAGPQGSQGPAGNDGASGPQGPIGLTGATGPAGATGATGPQGTQGLTGAQGPGGATGATGPAGPQGATGLTGAQGPQGPAGANGTNGTNGADGKTVLNGISNPTALIGSNGDFYINTTTNTIFGPKAAGAWPAIGVSLVGPQGLTGAQGPGGATGATGPAGPQGATGLTGAQGPQGPAGILSSGSAAGNTPYWNGTSWVVNNSNIYNNGGNVGIGITNPASKLEVNGAATNTLAFNAGSLSTIDFSQSNLALSSAIGTTYTLSNLKNGGAYSLVLTGTTNTGNAVFTGTGFTFKYMGTSAMTAGKTHIYSFIVAGNNVYVSMATEN